MLFIQSNSVAICSFINSANKMDVMGKKTKRRDLTAREKAAQQNLFRIWSEKKRGLGLTQDSAADKMGFKTQGAVNQYLNGRIPLNTDTVIKFAAILEVAPKEIDKEFGQFEAMKPTFTGKPDRLDIHAEIDQLPEGLLDKARHLLQYVKDTESRPAPSQAKAVRKK